MSTESEKRAAGQKPAYPMRPVWCWFCVVFGSGALSAWWDRGYIPTWFFNWCVVVCLMSGLCLLWSGLGQLLWWVYDARGELPGDRK